MRSTKFWGFASAALTPFVAMTMLVIGASAVSTTTVIYSFSGGADGEYLDTDLVVDTAGNLYGTTSGGGTSGHGTVYKLDTSGNETVLYSFTGGADGKNPYAGVIRDSAGNLYGTTYNGGAAGSGVVYKVDASGHETVLYSFTGGADGGNPNAGEESPNCTGHGAG